MFNATRKVFHGCKLIRLLNERVVKLMVLVIFRRGLENIFGFISIRSYDISEVSILDKYAVLVARLWKPLSSRVKQNITVDVLSYHNLQRKKNKACLFVYLLGYYIELLVCKVKGNLDPIYLILLARPVVVKPEKVILLLVVFHLFFEGVGWLLAGLDQVRYQSN
jgi:hypothetical protein